MLVHEFEEHPGHRRHAGRRADRAADQAAAHQRVQPARNHRQDEAVRQLVHPRHPRRSHPAQANLRIQKRRRRPRRRRALLRLPPHRRPPRARAADGLKLPLPRLNGFCMSATNLVDCRPYVRLSSLQTNWAPRRETGGFHARNVRSVSQRSVSSLLSSSIARLHCKAVELDAIAARAQDRRIAPALSVTTAQLHAWTAKYGGSVENAAPCLNPSGRTRPPPQIGVLQDKPKNGHTLPLACRAVRRGKMRCHLCVRSSSEGQKLAYSLHCSPASRVPRRQSPAARPESTPCKSCTTYIIRNRSRISR